MIIFNPIVTERLLIRPFSRTDNIEHMSWFFDPLVIAKTIGGGENNPEPLELRINRYIDHQSKYGFSKWLVIERSSGKFIGDCGIVSMSFDGHILNDIGFRLASQYWRKGMGFEMSKSWIRAYFLVFPCNLLYAHAVSDNIKSKSLLSKLGFSYESPSIIFGEDFNRYSLDKSSWDANLKCHK